MNDLQRYLVEEARPVEGLACHSWDRLDLRPRAGDAWRLHDAGCDVEELLGGTPET